MSGDLVTDSRLMEDVERRMRAFEANQRELALALKTGFERIEARSDARAERMDARFERLQADNQKLVEGLAELKGRVSQLPTTITLLAFVLAVLGMAGALRVFAH